MKQDKEVRRYSIRKLTVGAASVLIGLAFMKPATAHADEQKDGENSNPQILDKEQAQIAGAAQTKAQAPIQSQAQNATQAQTEKQSPVQSAVPIQNKQAQSSQINQKPNPANPTSKNQPVGAVRQNAAKQVLNTAKLPVSQSKAELNNLQQSLAQAPSQSIKQDLQTVQQDLGNQADVQGDDAIHKSRTIKYIDKITGQEIKASKQEQISFVPYYHKAQGTITYVDQTTNQAVVKSVIHGYQGGKVTIDPSVLEGLISKGYTITKDNSVNQRYNLSGNDYTVYLGHQILATNGKTIQASQTVKYVDEQGNELHAPDVQTDVFIQKADTQDLVTGQVTKGGAWNRQAVTMHDVKVPVIDGYLATKGTISGDELTLDKPNTIEVVIYKKLGQIIPVNVSTDDDANTTYTPINQLKPFYYKVNPNDASQLAEQQILPTFNGYRPQNATVDVTDPFKNTNAVYVVDKNATGEKGKADVQGGQIIKYVDEKGNSLYPASMQNYTFVLRSDGTYENTSHTFDTIYTPVIDGYVADKKMIKGQTVTVEKPQANFKVTYTKVGNFIPVDADGKKIGNPVPYRTDSADPTLIRNDEVVPDIGGYTPKQSTITPVDASEDTKVVYIKNTNKRHITIQFIDDGAGGSTIESKDLTGVDGEPCDYDPTDDIDRLRGMGYTLDNNYMPSNLIFTKEPQEYQIAFAHKSSTVDPADYYVNGDPIDSSSPNGVKANIGDWKREYYNTVHFQGAGAATPSDTKEKLTWTRHFIIDEVTGEKKVIDHWQNDLGNEYSQVEVPVVQTYHSDTNVVTGVKADMSNHEETVTYERNGRMILDFYDQNGHKLKTIKGPYWITDPTDPRNVLPEEKVPVYKDFIQTVRKITPSRPDRNEHIVYIHVPDKVIVPVPVPELYAVQPTMADVVSLAEQQIGKKIEHPVVVATNMVTEPSDLVYPYEEGQGSEVGKQVRKNWIHLQHTSSYYDNAQEGDEFDNAGNGTDLTKTSPGDPFDITNTTGNMISDQRDLSENYYDPSGTGLGHLTDEVEVRDGHDDHDSDNKGVVIKAPNEESKLKPFIFQKVNHENKIPDWKYYKDNDYDGLTKDNWDVINLDTKNYGNNYQTLTVNAAAMPMEVLTVNLAKTPEQAKEASVMAFKQSLAESPNDDSFGNLTNKDGDAIESNDRLSSSQTGSNSDVTGNSNVTNSNQNDSDWEPTVYYDVVVDGKIVARGLTKEEVKKYRVEHRLDNIDGYKPLNPNDDSVGIDSPNDSTEIYYYTKDSTSTDPTGDHGNTGDQGDTDSHGNTGDQGNTGSHGNTGDQGNTGSHGNTGDQGNTGSHGNTGDQGNTGSQGNTGDQGGTGSHGNTGDQGNTGSHGNAGDQGNTGSHGNTGDQGNTGSHGNASDQGDTGSHGNTGDQGNTGNHGNTGDQGGTSSHGNTGDQGGTGSHGNTGDQGGTGSHGNTGDQDDTSNHGNTGDQGNAGSHGNTGDQGGTSSHGNTGDQGSTSSHGNTGDQGSTSSHGNTGDQGNTGNHGNTGDQGGTGSHGNTGDQGNTGSHGNTGNQGGTGSHGNTGDQGNVGSHGNIGDQSSTGIHGNTDDRGNTGSHGNTDDQGNIGSHGNTGDQGNTGGQDGTSIHGNTGDRGNTGDQGNTGNHSNTGSQGNAGSQDNATNKGNTGATINPINPANTANTGSQNINSLTPNRSKLPNGQSTNQSSNEGQSDHHNSNKKHSDSNSRKNRHNAQNGYVKHSASSPIGIYSNNKLVGNGEAGSYYAAYSNYGSGYANGYGVGTNGINPIAADLIASQYVANGYQNVSQTGVADSNMTTPTGQNNAANNQELPQTGNQSCLGLMLVGMMSIGLGGMMLIERKHI